MKKIPTHPLNWRDSPGYSTDHFDDLQLSWQAWTRLNEKAGSKGAETSQNEKAKVKAETSENAWTCTKMH